MAEDFLLSAIIFLGAAIVCVPIAKKIGLGSVLGYLIAGILIGPFVLGFVGQEGQDIMQAAGVGLSGVLLYVEFQHS
jgi:CPA2 family monovalent cation:H+ antiporter-2